MAATINFLKRVILSNTTTEIRTEALGFLLEALNGATAIGGIPVDPDTYMEVMSHLKKDPCGRIMAIKMLRAGTNMSLKDALEAVDRHRAWLKTGKELG